MNGRRRQHGQSLVETLVFALALVPLLLGLVFVTKYQNIRQATVAGSRSAAFDCTVRADGCGAGPDVAALMPEAWHRHFALPSTLHRSVTAVPADAAPLNPFWVDRTAAPLVASTEAVRVDVAREAADTTAALNLSAFGLPGHVGLRLGDDLVCAEVHAQVSSGWRLADWLVRPRGLALELSGRTAIAVDGWNASEGRGSDGRSVAVRTQRASEPPLPGFAAATDAGYFAIRRLIRSPLLAPFEPRGRQFHYHEWDVEIVPEDRLPDDDE